MKMTSMEIDPTAGTGSDHLSHLPLEIQLLILQKLDYVEFSRFGTVCKTWRLIASATRRSPLFHLQQVPWIIQRIPPGQKLPKLSHQKFLYKLELLDVNESYCICGSSEGWLLLCSCPAAYLLNPITLQKISLPKHPKSMEAGVILPHQSADGLEVVAYFTDDSFYQWRSQDKHWTEIVGVGNSGINGGSHMFYHKGDIYVINNYNLEDFFVINVNLGGPYHWQWTLSPVLYNDKLCPMFSHLVECDGDLLMVVGSFYRLWSWEEETVVDVSVFKCIDPNGDGYGWRKVNSIGEKYALLVGKGNNMAIDVSTNTAGFTANCIYFLENHHLGHQIRSFNLGSNTFKIFMVYKWHGASYISTWFMPRLT